MHPANPPHLTINLDVLKPVACSDEFAALLGYQRKSACLKSLEQVAHFGGCNFLQMLYSAQSNAENTDIAIFDKDNRRVGWVDRIRLGPGHRFMRVEIGTPAPETHTGAAYLPPATLHLNRRLAIVGAEENAGAWFPVDVVGRDLVEAIAPDGLQDRLQKIYAWQLRRRDSFSLEHCTTTLRRELDRGRWQISRFPGGAVQANFLPCRDTATMDLIVDTMRGRLVCGKSWSRLLGLEEFVPKAWYEAVLEEDRPLVTAALQHPRLPDGQRLFYRMAGADGTVVSIEHRVTVAKRSASGHRLTGRLIQHPASTSKLVGLQSLALVHDLAIREDAAVRLHGSADLSRVLQMIRRTLAGDGLETDLTIAASEVTGLCSLCEGGGAMAGGGSGMEDTLSLAIVVPGLKLSRRELHELVESDASFFHINRASGWKALFTDIHRAGFHVLLALSEEDSFTLHLQSAAIDNE